jgi:hypothetical protein
MHKIVATGLGSVAVASALFASGEPGFAQAPTTPRVPRTGREEVGHPAAPLYTLEEGLLRWALPPGSQAYGAIDGRHMHQYVVEQVAIARRYRDQGHQYWGRIMGTSGDVESQDWLTAKFKAIGLTDVHTQSFDLTPQWMPQSWEVTATGRGPLASAQPGYGSPATPTEGLYLEATYAGFGSEADYIGRDVRGKAVFLFSMPRPASGLADGAFERASAKGAAAIFEVSGLPGNVSSHGSGAGKVPTFSIGLEDGRAIRDAIGTAAGQAPHVKIRLDVKTVPNLRTGIVWGTLTGATDETIYIMAHRDSWFDGATDNASGVASMLGLAEYFAKMPRAQRRRTIVFLGMDGHHNSGAGQGVGREWLVAHRSEFFTTTALMINCEHPATLQTYVIANTIRRGNTATAQQWYAGGPTRPKLQDIAVKAFRDFGVATYAEPNRQPPSGDLGRFFWFLPGVATSDFYMFFHTDLETPETVPWTGLEAATRSYARIVDEVNKLPLSDLQRPEERDPRAGATATAGQER